MTAEQNTSPQGRGAPGRSGRVDLSWVVFQEGFSMPNRHERRRRVKLARIGRAVQIIADEFHKIDVVMCAWGDCGEMFSGEMPPGWSWTFAYWSPSADILSRLYERDGGKDVCDVALC